MEIITAILSSKLPNRLLRTLVLFLVCAGFAFQFPLSPAIAERSTNEILAGVHRNFPPQYSLDEKTGQPVGFAIDIMDEVARRAGLKIRYAIFDEWPQSVQALKEGRIDIIPNIGIAEERNADMDFTSPYEALDINIFVRSTTTDIHGIDDLQGRKVGVVRDNAGIFIIQKYGRAKPVIFNSLDQALLSLLSGNTDALVYPGPPVLLITSKSKLSERVKTVGKALLEVKRAIAVGKGKTDLLNKLDTAVKELLPTPEYKKIYARWYGVPEPYWNVRRVLILAGLVLVLAIVIFAGWHYLSLRRLNRDLKYALEERKKANEAQRENAARLKVALTPIDMAVFNQDIDLRYTWMYQPQIGYTTEQVIGKTDAELLPPDAARLVTEIKRRVLENGTGAHGEVEVALEDRTIYYDLVIEPLRNGAGQVVGITGASLDITERKKAEKKLSQMNRELRMLSNANQALIHITDEATLLNEICRIAVEVGGYRMAWVGFAEHDEVKTIRPVAHAGFNSGYVESANVTWADNERGRGPGGTAIRTGQPCMARNIPLDPAFAPWRVAAAIQRGYKSNIALPLISVGQTLGELTLYPVETDAFDAQEVEILKELAGDLAFGIIALRTRAMRDLAEEALRMANAYNRNLIEVSLDPLVTIGKDGKITDVNAATEAVTGFTRAELIGTDFSSYFTEPDKAREGYEQVFRAGFVRDYTLDIKHKDGTITSVLYNASIYKDDAGTVIGVFAAARDITLRKRAEEKIKASLLEKETLLMEIYHRVKNNMQVISSLLGLQSSYLQDEKAKAVLQNSIDRVKTMAEIHNLLYHSDDLARVDLGSFIRNLTGRLQQSYSVAESPVDIHVDTADVSLTIETAIPCGLILNELVTNALKYAFPKGKEGEIHIRMRSEDSWVVLTVRDNGVGFPDTVDFQHAQSLGLELVNLLVGQLNGTISLEVDGGTTFTVTIPVNRKGG